MSSNIIMGTAPLGFPWQTVDPFLFCAYHDDDYPAGNDDLGPDAPLDGRNIGMDFEVRDGWRMYHGDVVPGFPRHPHRGFETITIARAGFIDHADSLGATARFGEGDVQWMTAGHGIEHSEMFPLLRRDDRNHTELFQIWLNLPRASKRVPAHFTMFWSETIPRHKETDEAGRSWELAVIAGAFAGHEPPAPPPDSWAAASDSDVAVWTMNIDADASLPLPPAHHESTRVLYFYEGTEIEIDGERIGVDSAVQVRPDAEVVITARGDAASLLMLQGRPIGEPVVHHGPFVMNSPDEIRATIMEYRSGGFGEWNWGSAAPVHERDAGRFAIHADGRRDQP